MSPIARALTCTLLLGIVVACASADDPEPLDSLQAELVHVIGGEAAESFDSQPLLQMPAYLRLDREGRIWTLDTGRKAAVAFDLTGTEVAAAGREGRGPGELRTTMAMDVAPDGSVWVIDVGGGKLVHYVDGAMHNEIRLEGPPSGVVAFDDEVWVAGDLFDSVFMRYDESGTLIARVGTPINPDRRAFRLNQGVAARGSGACAAVWAYTFYSQIECYASDGTLRWSAEPPTRIRPRPDVDPERSSWDEPMAYTDVQTWDGSVYALFLGGPSDDGIKTSRMHAFREDDGSFVGEITLPRPAHHFTRSDSLLILAEYSPVPAIYSYRLINEP